MLHKKVKAERSKNEKGQTERKQHGKKKRTKDTNEEISQKE